MQKVRRDRSQGANLLKACKMPDLCKRSPQRPCYWRTSLPGFQRRDGCKITVEVTQINLNHCDTAQQLLLQSVAESKSDVAIIAEPYRIPPGDGNWIADKAKTAAIWTMGSYPIQDVVCQADEGFVIAKINGVFFCSCYAPPRWSIDQFNQMLDKLTDVLTGLRSVVIAGDFNAWAIEWGSRCTNPRGQNLLEALARLDVELVNEGTTSTYRWNGRESIIDITFCSPGLVRSMNWRVCEKYTHSDHQAIRYRIGGRVQTESTGWGTNVRQWKTAEFNSEVFAEVLRNADNLLNLSADELIAQLSRACDACMPRKRPARNGRRPVYWWNAMIADLRKDCLRARRRMQRARDEHEREERRALFRTARAALKREIRVSKAACFKELFRNADTNPWGDAYRVAMAKIKGPALPPERCPERMKAIVETLFPQHEPTNWPPTPYAGEGYQTNDAQITNDELIAAAKAMKVKKAPGPDGIPNVALKAAINEIPDTFRTTLQKCINEGSFPDIWKRQKLVLLPKSGKPPGDPSAYRPICLLDTVGKLLERVIVNRLLKFTESESGISNMQFGFRKGRCTVDAIRAVVEVAEKAKKQQRRGNRYCAVVTLDVKNAFNSASWEVIASSLHGLRVPEYLCRIIGSYFVNRSLIYETTEGLKSTAVTAGVPQGSVLGPTLWNIMYDGVLRLKLPGGVKIVGFADDIVLSVVGGSCEEVEVLATEAIDMVETWMQERKLAVAHHKTEVVMISNRKTAQQMKISVGECTINSKRAVRHLGVMVDDRLSFNSHVDYSCEKAAKTITALSRIMPNDSAITSSKRRLLASVAMSVLRYGSPAWSSALLTKRNQAKLDSVHRLISMRVASAYRTISLEAVCVIAGLLPIGIVLDEDTDCYRRRETKGIRKIVRADSMRKWQHKWDGAANGRWTHRLIPNVTLWMERKHGEVNFHLTQFLSGHGCFRKYLHRFGHARSPFCPECSDVEESPEHVIFECPRFQVERNEMEAVSGDDVSTDNVVERMCSSEAMWNSVNNTVVRILTTLQKKWRDDQRQMSERAVLDLGSSGRR